MNNGIRNIFSEVPETYELVNRILTLGMDVLWRRKAVRIAVAGGGSNWLDVCSGTGETAMYLRRTADGKAGPAGKDKSGSVNQVNVFAVDFCLPMVKRALLKPESPGVHFSLADAGQLPFENNLFDLITISFATRNLNTNRTHLLQCFQEFHRVLKPSGRFVNLETSQPENSIMRKIVHSYVSLLVRPIGKLVSGSGAGYTYLSRTIPRFYAAPELKELLLSAGFREVSYDRLLGGVAAIHRAVK